MNRLWTEEGVTYDGEFYSVEDATITPRPEEKPEVWVAANSRPAIERAARIGDRWFVNPHATVSEITDQKSFYDERKDGDTSVPVFREVFVAETTEEAREVARPYLEPKYERYRETLDPSHVVCRVQWPGLSYERARECIELIGDEVIPRVDG